MDTIVTIASAGALLVVGLTAFYLAFSRVSRATWYWCPRCKQWQNIWGEYGVPGKDDILGGHNLCSGCEQDIDKETQ